MKTTHFLPRITTGVLLLTSMLFPLAGIGATAGADESASAWTHITAIERITKENGNNRLTGSQGNHATQKYIIQQLEALGLNVEKQSFEAAEERTGTNLIADIPGSSDSDKVVLIGAHYDSVAGGPGINDNASGAASLLNIAEAVVAAHPMHTVRVAFWDDEEQGLVGSKAYAEAMTLEETLQTIAYINMDMTGTANPTISLFDSDGSSLVRLLSERVGPGIDPAISKYWPTLTTGQKMEATLRHAFEEAGYPVEDDITYNSSSDTGPFALKVPTAGIVAVHEVLEEQPDGGVILSFAPGYHTQDDTLETVDPEVLATVTRILRDLVLDVAQGKFDDSFSAQARNALGDMLAPRADTGTSTGVSV